MSKVRVHEYAKKVNKTSKEIIDHLTKIDQPVKNHMAVIDVETVSKLDSVFKQVAEPTKNTSMKPTGKAANETPKAQQGQPKKKIKYVNNLMQRMINQRNQTLPQGNHNRNRAKNKRMQKVTKTEI